MRLEQDTEQSGKKDYNVIIDGKNSFDQPVENVIRTYNIILKFTTDKGDNYRNLMFTRLYLFQRTLSDEKQI